MVSQTGLNENVSCRLKQTPLFIVQIGRCKGKMWQCRARSTHLSINVIPFVHAILNDLKILIPARYFEPSHYEMLHRMECKQALK